MDDVSFRDRSGLAVECVRCLSCGKPYAKPFGRGTVEGNPGCPGCGYVGWIAASIAVKSEALARRRFAGDLRRHLLARSG